jgi:hypothetical protein
MDGLWIAPVLAQAADKAPPTTATLPWQFFVIVAVVFILPFVLGTLIAQALRLKDLGGQIGVVLFSIALAVSPFAYHMLQGQPWTNAISLGIDLAGGTNLIYAVDLVKAKADEKPIDNATLVQTCRGHWSPHQSRWCRRSHGPSRRLRTAWKSSFPVRIGKKSNRPNAASWTSAAWSSRFWRTRRTIAVKSKPPASSVPIKTT